MNMISIFQQRLNKFEDDCCLKQITVRNFKDDFESTFLEYFGILPLSERSIIYKEMNDLCQAISKNEIPEYEFYNAICRVIDNIVEVRQPKILKRKL